MKREIDNRLGFNFHNPPEELTRDQMRNVIDLLLDPQSFTQHEGERLLAIFKRHCKHPGGSDIIYWPNLAGFSRPLTRDEILAAATGEWLD